MRLPVLRRLSARLELWACDARPLHEAVRWTGADARRRGRLAGASHVRAARRRGRRAEEAAAAGGSILPPPAKSPALGVGSSPRAEAASLQLALTVAGDSSDHSGALVPAAPERKGNKYRGVYVDKQADNKWKASIRLNHKELHLGYYDSEELAARAYDKANICVKGVPKNLKHPGAFSDADIEVIKSFDGDVEKLRRWMGVGYDAKRCTSAHRGVCKEKKTGKWRAEIQRRGKKESLGYHELEEDAVRAYDRACIVINGDAAKTNRPASEYEAERALLLRDELRHQLREEARRQRARRLGAVEPQRAHERGHPLVVGRALVEHRRRGERERGVRDAELGDVRVHLRRRRRRRRAEAAARLLAPPVHAEQVVERARLRAG